MDTARTAPHRQHRRSEILDVAQRMVLQSKGYADMSIQDILDDLGISKGAFYHYFSSKQDLLEALVERMVSEAEPPLLAIVRDPDLPALEKMRRFFRQAATWKTTRKEYLQAFLRLWYADENAILREKLRATMPERYAPLLSEVVQQGVDEGVLQAAYPEQAGVVILSLLQALGDTFARLILEPAHHDANMLMLQDTTMAFNDAVERVLGAPAGSLPLMDPGILQVWVERSGPPS